MHWDTEGSVVSRKGGICTIDGGREIGGRSGHALATQEPTADNVHMK